MSSPSVILWFNSISGSQKGFSMMVTVALPISKENVPVTP
jgi:hypothetical protein